MAKMVDPLPGKSASIERACQSVSAERASRCASRVNSHFSGHLPHFLACRDRTNGHFRLETKCYLAEMKALQKPTHRTPRMVMRPCPLLGIDELISKRR